MSGRNKLRATPWIAAGLLALFAALALASLRTASITGDEVSHLPAGYSYVATGDFRMNPQHPPLVKALAGLPLLALDLDPVESTPGWSESAEWTFGRHFLSANREPVERLAWFARLPMVGLGVVLGFVLFAWARALWGDTPALLALALYALCPNFLAHTQTVTTDVGVALGTVLAVGATWRFIERRGRFTDAALLGGALGLALLAKYSAVLTVAIALGLLAFAATLRLIEARVALGGAAVALAVALGLVAVGFDAPHGIDRWLDGFGRVYADGNPRWEGFLDGRYSANGFPHYYLMAQLWKTPLPTLALGLAGLAALLVWVARAPRDRARWLTAALIVGPFAAFHIAFLFHSTNIGVRHVLPAFPFLFLGAAAGLSIATRRSVSWSRVARRTGLAFLGALLVWLAAGTLRAHPHYLPWFNELAGGTMGGIERLDDSNIEWGENFWRIRDWLNAHPPGPRGARLFAFEPLPRALYGVEAGRVGLRDVVWPELEVTYLMGAHYLQRSSLYNRYPGVRLEWLARRYPPVDSIGGIFVYRFTLDPARAGDPDWIVLDRDLWLAQAREQLVRILALSPTFTEARGLLAEIEAESAARVR